MRKRKWWEYVTYFQWNVQKEMELRKDGAWYQISPWVLMWDDENYYLVAYDAEENLIKHYWVDKMLKLSMTGEPRLGQEIFRQFNMPKYTKSLFGMNSGEETAVTLEAENTWVGVMIDRFGKDIMVVPVDENHFRTTVNVAVSSQFLGWIIALGEGVRIVSPKSVVNRMRSEAERLMRQYVTDISP